MSGLTLQTLNGLMVVAAESAEQNILIQIVTVIICFFLVFWVLKRYAFGPILQVLDERTEHVQNDLNRRSSCVWNPKRAAALRNVSVTWSANPASGSPKP